MPSITSTPTASSIAPTPSPLTLTDMEWAVLSVVRGQPYRADYWSETLVPYRFTGRRLAERMAARGLLRAVDRHTFEATDAGHAVFEAMTPNTRRRQASPTS